MNLFQDLRTNYGHDFVKRLRSLENTEKKIARLRNHMVFTLRCKSDDITPPSLKVKCPIDTDRARAIVNRARLGLLRERLRVSNNRLNELNEVKVGIEQDLLSQLPSDKRDVIISHLTRVRENEHKQTKWRHERKFKRMLEKKAAVIGEVSQEHLKKWVRNESSRVLSESETRLLAKGLNFSVAPNKIPVNDFILATEKATWSLAPDQAEQLRSEVTGLIKNAKPPKSNLTQSEQKALKNLQKDKSILILPADKGKATVVLDKEKYEEKVRTMLEDDKTYEKLEKDPTPKYKRKLVDILKKLKADKKITQDQYDHLYPTAENVPRMYCTPKIHKPNTPLRPIVDYCGSIGYNTSRALADVLGPLVGKTRHHVKNSKDFSKDMATVVIEDEDMFNSHDVVSLFTNTPIQEALSVIEDRLKADHLLKDRTNLKVEDIMTLLEFILTTTYFSFRHQIYQQKFGTAMGSPVSPIVANLYMEFLEQKAIATAPLDCRPKLWKRYVDDVLEVVKKGQVNNLTEHLNTVDETDSIKFTDEAEKEGRIPFLDTLIVREPDGSVKLMVYRKKTHTDQYLQFDSHHPLQHKYSVIRTLMDRCESVVNREEERKEERKHITEALMVCGYPKWTIYKVKKDMNTKRMKDKGRGKKRSEEKSKGMVVLPYVKKLSESVCRVMKKYGIATAMRPHQTLRNALVHPKDKVSTENVCGCVYSISCKNCKKAYIGETGRKFGTRLAEHKTDSTNAPQVFTRSERRNSEHTYNKSAITDHIAQTNHVIDWEGAKVIDKEENQRLRQVKEAIWIATNGHVMNRDQGAYSLSNIYGHLVHSDLSSSEQVHSRNQSQF